MANWKKYDHAKPRLVIRCASAEERQRIHDLSQTVGMKINDMVRLALLDYADKWQRIQAMPYADARRVIDEDILRINRTPIN